MSPITKFGTWGRLLLIGLISVSNDFRNVSETQSMSLGSHDWIISFILSFCFRNVFVNWISNGEMCPNLLTKKQIRWKKIKRHYGNKMTR
jgi:hypothetical protein